MIRDPKDEPEPHPKSDEEKAAEKRKEGGYQ